MSRVIHFAQESSVGPWARRMRMSLRMTKQELANMCGVSRDEVDLFEHNLPVGLDTEDRLLKKLRSAKTALCQTFPR